MTSATWIKEFANPPAVYRPVPFWSWNEKMEPVEVRRQIDLMKQAGWGGGFVHSRVGLTTPYLGDEWFKAVDAAIEACRANGMKVWLYDEDKWPSGFSGGSVPLADEAFRMKGLVARKVGAPAPTETKPLGQPHDGVQVYSWIAPLGYDWFNGTCYADLTSRRAMRKFLDDAYETYYARYKDSYGTDILAEFTDEPCTLHRGRTPIGCVPFGETVIERFVEIHGFDPTEKLYLLFTDAPEAAAFRLKYFRTINDLFENNFSKQIGDWCRERGIALTGHFMSEQDLYDSQRWGVKIMPNYRHEGIPGIDHLCRQIDERLTAKQCQSVVNQYGKPRMLSEIYGVAGGALSFEDRLWIASQQMCLGVNLLNHHLSLYTLAGCRKRDYPQNMYYQQPWFEVNRAIDDPLSRTCVALSQGKYVGEALIIHPGESSFVLWEALSESADDNYKENWKWNSDATTSAAKERIFKIDRDLKDLMDALFVDQRTFDFGDETILAEDGAAITVSNRPVIRIGQMDYPIAILSTMQTIAASTIDLLEKFIAVGGKVIRCGEAPTMCDGEESPRLQAFLAKISSVEVADLAVILRKHVSPVVELIDASAEQKRRLFVHVRDLAEDQRLVYLTNLNRTLSFNAKVCFAGDWKSARALDTRTGKESPLCSITKPSEILIDLPFAPTQNHLIVLSREPSDSPGVDLVSPALPRVIDLPPDRWTVERLDDNAICLDYAAWREGDGEWSVRPMPVLSIQQRLNDLKWDGKLALRYTARVNTLSPDRKVHLVVEHPERYRIHLNGQEIKYAGLPFWRDIRWMPIDITGQLRDGDNLIELTCDFQHGDLANVHDQFARYGTEIESIYLVGDFAVDGTRTDEVSYSTWWKKWELPPVGVQCFAEKSFTLSNPKKLHFGDTTTQGLPFYAGRLRFSIAAPSELKQGTRAILRIGSLDAAVADVRIDDRFAGYFVSHPLEVDLTDSLRDGGKTISITLYGTLRNLLGPHHHIEGELPVVGPDMFGPKYEKTPTVPDWIDQWTRGQVQPADWRDRYCMVRFGELGNVELKTV